ncbi:MAG: hypothetical protein AABX70_03660, partial [Nanoarchaeota archaeon]
MNSKTLYLTLCLLVLLVACAKKEMTPSTPSVKEKAPEPIVSASMPVSADTDASRMESSIAEADSLGQDLGTEDLSALD